MIQEERKYGNVMRIMIFCYLNKSMDSFQIMKSYYVYGCKMIGILLEKSYYFFMLFMLFLNIIIIKFLLYNLFYFIYSKKKMDIYNYQLNFVSSIF